nr:hypothetical protein [Nocardioides humi]
MQHLLGRQGEPVGVGLDEREQPVAHVLQALLDLGPVVEVRRRSDEAHRAHQPEDRQEPLLQDRRHRQHPLAQRQGEVDLVQAPQHVTGLEGARHRGVDELVLGREHPEDGPFRDPGRLGDQPGGHPAPVVVQEGTGHPDQRLPALLGRHRCGTGWHARHCK